MTWSLAILSAFTAAVAYAGVGGWCLTKGTIWRKGGVNAAIHQEADEGNVPKVQVVKDKEDV
jgi:hypothetical protein